AQGFNFREFGHSETSVEPRKPGNARAMSRQRATSECWRCRMYAARMAGQERIGVESLEAGLALIASRPAVTVVLFAKGWDEVDRCRALIRARGVEDRIRVHHRLAMLCTPDRN